MMRDAMEFEISENAIHTWVFPLVATESDCEMFRELLDADEITRAERFHFAKHRHRFIVAHGVMRCLIAAVLQRAPGSWRWQTSDRGKPYLPSDVNALELQFNLSHSSEMGFLAITRSRQLGADIERVRELKDATSLAGSYYSTVENEALADCRTSENKHAFFRFWTRKEAFLKATGEGLGGGLSRYCTAGSRGGQYGHVRSIANDEPLEWIFFDCPSPHDYHAAIVSNFMPVDIRCHQLIWRK